MSQPPPPPSMPQPGFPPPPPRSWWIRNWKWVVPVGCLTPLLVCGGLVAMLISVGLGAIKSTEPYADSLAKAQADTQVQAAIGTPINAAYFVTGNINLNNDAGDANLEYNISGPNGSGTVYVEGTKTAGVWTYTMMEFRDSAGNTIDLLPVE